MNQIEQDLLLPSRGKVNMATHGVCKCCPCRPQRRKYTRSKLASRLASQKARRGKARHKRAGRRTGPRQIRRTK